VMGGVCCQMGDRKNRLPIDHRTGLETFPVTSYRGVRRWRWPPGRIVDNLW
jgi:hypothetical protein